MSESIRMTPLSTHIGADLSKPNPTARAKTPNPGSASLPKGGSQIENLKSLGSRAAAGKTQGKTEAESARAPLTRTPSFSEWLPRTAAPATSQDDDWAELDDIFRRQPAAGQASNGAPTHSLIDAPQVPLHASVSTAGPQRPAARQEPARSGSSGMLGAIKRSAKSLLGLSRSPSPPKPSQAPASRPLRAAPPPVAAPKDPVAETVDWIHQQNGRPATWRNVIPKLSVEQARREGKPVPSRRPPSLPTTIAGSTGPLARPSASAAERQNPLKSTRTTKPTIGSGTVAKPQALKSDSAARRVASPATTTVRRPAKRPLQSGGASPLSTLGPLPVIPEHRHETGALASIGQHYDGLWRDLRVSIHGADSARQSLRTTPKKGLAAKRAELESHAATLKRLIAETSMTKADLKTVEALKREAPASPGDPDALHTRAELVGRDIHETVRQSKHAQVALDRLNRTIASLPQSTGR